MLAEQCHPHAARDAAPTVGTVVRAGGLLLQLHKQPRCRSAPAARPSSEPWHQPLRCRQRGTAGRVPSAWNSPDPKRQPHAPRCQRSASGDAAQAEGQDSPS